MAEPHPDRAASVHKGAALALSVHENESFALVFDPAMVDRHGGLLDADRVGRVSANGKPARRQLNLGRGRAG